MRRPRVSLAACCVALGVCGVAAPAVALGDGSAGDQQYTDPFSGGSGGGGGAGSSATTTSTRAAPAPSTQTATAPAAAPPATATATAPAAPTPVPQSSSTSPLATVAAPSSGQTLPYTGYADWTVAGFGVTLLAGGLVLRRRTAA